MPINKRIAFLQPRIPDGNYLPNLGIMYLAAVLERDGFTVQVFDENIDASVENDIVEFAPAVLGITCVTAALGSACRLSRRLKDRLQNLTIVVGGPHITAVPTETLTENDVIDYGIVGEAERTISDFCRLVTYNPQNLDAIHHIPGLVYRRDAEVQSNAAPNFLNDDELDALPLPAWHLLPMERIFGQATHGLFTRGKRIMPVMTTRGCPNYCTFCSRVMGFNFRRRSVESVVHEIQWLYDNYAIDEIYFEDDTFTQDPDRAHALLDAVIDLKLGIYIKFANGLRADKVDEALLKKMKAAGVYYVGFGIESGSPHTQELMMKKLDLNLAAENVRLAKKMGFKVGTGCIIGYPGETRQDTRVSLDFFLSLPFDSFAAVPCIPFPGTTAWMTCDRNGWLTERARNYDNYWFEIFKVNPIIETPHLSAEDMKNAIRRAYIRFYFLNPRRTALVARMMLRQNLHRITDMKWLRMLRANSANVPRPASPDYAC